MATLTASMRDAVASVGSEKEYRKAQKVISTPITKATPAAMAKLRRAKAYVEVFEKGSLASPEAILTLAGPPMTFVEHRMRMEVYKEANRTHMYADPEPWTEPPSPFARPGCCSRRILTAHVCAA